MAVFDESGNYIATYWEIGDLISKPRMNKIEDAIWYNTKAIRELEKVDHSLYQQIKDNDLATKSKTVVGGINELVSNVNLMLDALDVPPTYTAPTSSVSASKTTIAHNEENSITIVPKFNRNDSGGLSLYEVKDGDTVLYSSSSASNYADKVTLAHGESKTYNCVFTYREGTTKDTLLGISYPSGKILEGSISSSVTVKGYANSYYGVISSNTISTSDISKLTARSSTSKSYTYTTNLTNQRIVYMYPKDFGKITSIKDANNFDYINSYTLSEMTYNGVEYYVYILTDPVTITNFKQIFS